MGYFSYINPENSSDCDSDFFDWDSDESGDSDLNEGELLCGADFSSKKQVAFQILGEEKAKRKRQEWKDAQLKKSKKKPALGPLRPGNKQVQGRNQMKKTVAKNNDKKTIKGDSLKGGMKKDLPYNTPTSSASSSSSAGAAGTSKSATGAGAGASKNLPGCKQGKQSAASSSRSAVSGQVSTTPSSTSAA
ncbi:unnamed protein product [Amoebophrya sp. A120]|nr:unnamed protein product [Amoebophrya sp. A120]|eukprot:GSA120T00015573001.1